MEAFKFKLKYMEFVVVEKTSKRIGIFTDIHVGVASDSKLRLDETKKCMKWIISAFKKEKVDWVIFCGDLFNSRFSINVNTLNAGIEIVEDLAYNFEKVFLIEGNHDTYYKNSNSVNSVKFLQKIGKNDNIFSIDEEPMFLKIKDKTFGLYPWAFMPEDADKISGFKTPDFGFGHFEMNGIEQSGSRLSSGNKYGLHEMLKLGDMLFSGHYHINKMYKDFSTGGLLYMVGSPLQLDWGDYGREKKIVVLDTEDSTMKEISNKTNAEFKKVFYSEMAENRHDDSRSEEVVLPQLCEVCHRQAVQF